MSLKQLNVKIPEQELRILEAFAENGRFAPNRIATAVANPR